MEEIWKDIPECNGEYQASNIGRVRSFKRGKYHILKPGTYKGGYLKIYAFIKGKGRGISVHRAVALAFIPNSENKQQVNHINGIKTDNRLENLEWCTASENIRHAYNTGLNVVTENHYFKQNHPKYTLGRFGKDHNLSKTVHQLTMEGEFIREWGSTMDVQRELGISRSNISACCLGKLKSARGYKWRYLERIQGS